MTIVSASHSAGYRRSSVASGRRWRSPFGKQCVTGFAHGVFKRIAVSVSCSASPLAAVHVHVAGGDQRQAGGARKCRELRATRRIVGIEQPLGRDPQRSPKAGSQPQRRGRIERMPG